MALRSNMAAWPGCGIHRDIIYKTGGQKTKATTLFIHLVPKHTYSGTKGQFFNHMNVQLCNCNRPPPLLSVFYNEIDDYRGGWKRKRRGGKKTGGQCCHVDALSVMPAEARAVSRAGIFCSSVSALSLSLKSHTYSIHKISSMFGFDRKLKTKEQKRKIIPHKTKKFVTMMMSVGHCTQRKPQLCGDLCFVVPFVPKLLSHQIHLLFKGGGC